MTTEVRDDGRMPTSVDVEDGRVVVYLNGAQAVMALARQVSVPLAQVRSVTAVPDGGSVDLGWRVGGTAIPRRLRFGRFRSPRRGRAFAAVYCGQPAVVIETTGGDWDRIVITVPDAEAVAARVQRELPATG
jgi:hypothetical protein